MRNGGNLAPVVYSLMLRQVVRLLPGLPDYRTLKVSEIKYWYDTLRPELIEHTKNGE